MHLSLTLSLVLLWTDVVSASSIPRAPAAKCKKKLRRKPWHTLRTKEKKDYINAELCLINKPATLGLPDATNRFEELQQIHRIPAAVSHNVGAFLPYHRLHMHAHELALREECGYKGAQPYWDEPRDAGNFSKSIVLDPVTGFGGDGSGPERCITNGPFVGYKNGLGPGYSISNPKRCIHRVVNDTVSRASGQAYVNTCMKQKHYIDFWPCVELAPHLGGHGGVGGKMLDGISSPGDPVFYLHHTWLDKLWWDWQALDLPARLQDISGRNVAPPLSQIGLPDVDADGLPVVFPDPDTFPPFDTLIPPPGSPLPEGDPGNVTTLSHKLNMFGVVPNATIRDVMDIGGPLLCYDGGFP